MGFDSVYSRRSRLRLGLPLGSHASKFRAPPFFSNELSAYRDATALRWKTYRYAFLICTAVCTCFCVPSFGSCSVYGFFPGLKLPSKKKVRSLQSGWNLTPIYFRRPERPLSVAVSNCDLTSRLLLSARLYDAAPLCTDSTTAQAWPAPQEMLNSRCQRTAFSIYGRSHSARLADTAAEFSRLPRDRYGSWPSAAIGRGRVALLTKRTFCKWGKVHSRFFSRAARGRK